MYQCRLISCNKCTILVGDVDNVGDCTCVGADSTWEVSVPSIQFCCASKPALKKSTGKKKKKEKERKKQIHSPQYVSSSTVLVHQQYSSGCRTGLNNYDPQAKY